MCSVGMQAGKSTRLKRLRSATQLSPTWVGLVLWSSNYPLDHIENSSGGLAINWESHTGCLEREILRRNSPFIGLPAPPFVCFVLLPQHSTVGLSREFPRKSAELFAILNPPQLLHRLTPISILDGSLIPSNFGDHDAYCELLGRHSTMKIAPLRLPIFGNPTFQIQSDSDLRSDCGQNHPDGGNNEGLDYIFPTG